MNPNPAIIVSCCAVLVLGCLFGCGSDNIEDNGSIADPHPNGNNQIPTVTIEALQIENGGVSQKQIPLDNPPKVK